MKQLNNRSNNKKDNRSKYPFVISAFLLISLGIFFNANQLPSNNSELHSDEKVSGAPAATIAGEKLKTSHKKVQKSSTKIKKSVQHKNICEKNNMKSLGKKNVLDCLTALEIEMHDFVADPTDIKTILKYWRGTAKQAEAAQLDQLAYCCSPIKKNSLKRSCQELSVESLGAMTKKQCSKIIGPELVSTYFLHGVNECCQPPVENDSEIKSEAKRYCEDREWRFMGLLTAKQCAKATALGVDRLLTLGYFAGDHFLIDQPGFKAACCLPY